MIDRWRRDAVFSESGWRQARRLALDVCDAVLGIVLAPVCASCEAPLDHPLASPVCGACWSALRLITPPWCYGCGEPLPAWRAADVAGGRCVRCRRRRSALGRARALGPYDGTLRAIIHALKYDGRRSLGRQLSVRMRDHLGELLVGVDAVVPVPLHRARARARGFNQAVDLAGELGPAVEHLLVRQRATVVQAGLPRAQRHRNVRGAFRATSAAAAWQGATIAVIDDVATTGATLEACAVALLAAGVGEVRALTAARAVRSRP